MHRLPPIASHSDDGTATYNGSIKLRPGRDYGAPDIARPVKISLVFKKVGYKLGDEEIPRWQLSVTFSDKSWFALIFADPDFVASHGRSQAFQTKDDSAPWTQESGYSSGNFVTASAVLRIPGTGDSANVDLHAFDHGYGFPVSLQVVKNADGTLSIKAVLPLKPKKEGVENSGDNDPLRQVIISIKSISEGKVLG